MQVEESRFFSNRKHRFPGVWVLGGVGLVILTANFFILQTFGSSESAIPIRYLVILDAVYVGIIVILTVIATSRMISAGRSGAAGSRLHMRLGGLFAGTALIPSLLVAGFAAIFLSISVEGWFSENVRGVVGTSLEASRAYKSEEELGMRVDIRQIAAGIEKTQREDQFFTNARLREVLVEEQLLIQRGFKEAFIIDGAGTLQIRGDKSYLFGFEGLDAGILAQAATGAVTFVEDWEQNEYRALVRLEGFVDRYLYVTREVDGRLLRLISETQETAVFYNRLERKSGQLLYDLSLIYLVFAISVIFIAMYSGLRFAERVSAPVGMLTSAASRVSEGDFEAHIPPLTGFEEFAFLGKTFNRMTSEVKRQRDDLIASHASTMEQKQLFDSVISSVTAGVIGLDKDGQIEILNDAAQELIKLSKDHHVGKHIREAVPEFLGLWEKFIRSGLHSQFEEIQLMRSGRVEVLLVKMSLRRQETGEIEGYVITFDDVTALVSAQRMAAWGDVARRFAHEIKNPLTPIRLSAERLRKKFSVEGDDQSLVLDQYTDVIIRQTDDLRRIVDEFSRFARMPEPDLAEVNLCDVINDVLILEGNGFPDVTFESEFHDAPLFILGDKAYLTQAILNLVKNAAEATSAKYAKRKDAQPRVKVTLAAKGKRAIVEILDNGPGFPAQNRSRLFEPYVSNREGGTGLGLSIVKKIISQHDGTLELEDASVEMGAGYDGGALVRVGFPIGRANEAPDDLGDAEG